MNLPLKEIRLYGHLGRKFGRSHKFRIATPVEAFSALKANFPSFEKEMAQSNTFGCRIFIDFDEAEGDRIACPFGKEVIRIVPVVGGRGTGAEFVLADMIWYAASMYATSTLFAMAVNYLIITAISSILSPSPKKPGDRGTNERPENAPSYTFEGAVNTSAQGNAIAVGYGRLTVGSQVVSAGLYVDQI